MPSSHMRRPTRFWPCGFSGPATGRSGSRCPSSVPTDSFTSLPLHGAGYRVHTRSSEPKRGAMGTESRALCASVISSSTPAFRPGLLASRASWLMLLLVTALPLRIAAAVDMTGYWYLGVDSDPAVLVYLSQ